MLFNSYSFVFLFFPLCILGFYICRKIGEKTGKDWLPKAFLLLFSLWFYGFSGPKNLPAILLSMAVNYGLSFWMGKAAAEGKPVVMLLSFFAAVIWIFILKRKYDRKL